MVERNDPLILCWFICALLGQKSPRRSLKSLDFPKIYATLDRCLTGAKIFHPPWNRDLTHAGVAQLVERNLAKVEVDGSNPFARSKHKWAHLVGPFAFGARYGDPGRGSLSRDSTTTFCDAGDMIQSRKRGRESMGKLPVCTEY